ncbi:MULTISPECIES: sensor histidine kinase [Actinomadura]|uniref:histidine kinase n=1 Tax=Actinomadura yumaensis TaxID=111807 RepID=A0ABW2CFG3_9ACTN|nr:HAMP domain-containing sensor histidine kinase [Actinomadura sp. J1-007]MWK34396.1 HAMP domain-containing protein [Actinomadura sp. J1-007]
MRGALARIATAVTAMVALSFVVPLGLLNGQMAHDRALNAAERQAASLVPVLTVTADPAQLRSAVETTPAGAGRAMALYPPTGSPIGYPRATAGDLGKARGLRRSFTAPARGGTLLLRPVLLPAERVALVEVYVPDAEFGRGVLKSWTILALVALALVLVSVAMADRLAVRVVRAADRLADAVTRVAGGDLTTRVRPGGPAELRAAGEAFNHMADRLARLLADEREAAADLSHRLRTPLTALRLNLNGLAADPSDPSRMAQSQDALGRLEQAVDDVIATARRPDRGPAGCDAAEVVRRRLEFWSALAGDQRRAHDVVIPDEPVPVPVAEAELAAVVDALLGNIFRHTPHGTAFSVTVHHGRHSTGLLFGDAGPGIGDAEAALQRGASGSGSTGLGLDIARRLAETTGGTLRIGTSTLGGAQIQVWLRTVRTPAPRRSGRSRGRAARRR